MKFRKVTNVEKKQLKKLIKRHNNLLNQQENSLKKLKQDIINSDKEIKQSKERIRKMKMTTMWVGWITGFATIVIVSLIVAREFTKATPNMLVIVIDTFAFFMAVNLIYRSYKTRHELRRQIQDEILQELEKD